MQVCASGERLCTIYNIVIPDIDAANGSILQRSNLFYYRWKKPASAVELETISPCYNVKLYAVMKTATQGELILDFISSATVGYGILVSH